MDTDMALAILRWLRLALNRAELVAGDGMAVPVPATLAWVPAMSQQQKDRGARSLNNRRSLVPEYPLPSD